MTKNFVPANFAVPTSFADHNFQLEILEQSVVELDYEAVMSSRVNLRSVFAENDEWPADDMTLEENMNDLVIHEKEFKAREAFAYTVLSPDKSCCIGCLYIEPCNREGIDAEIYFWIRDDILHLEAEFEKTIKNWLTRSWPFNRIVFPGRDIAWKEWGTRSHDHI